MKIKRIALGAAVAGAALGVSAAAMAAFSTSSVFTASGHAAKVTSAQVQGHISDELMPGHWSDVEFTVTNPNSYPVAIGTVYSPEYNPAVDRAHESCANDFQINWGCSHGSSSKELTGTPRPRRPDGHAEAARCHRRVRQLRQRVPRGRACPSTSRWTSQVAPGTEAGLA